MQNYKPVSYTHLDVYKRQGVFCEITYYFMKDSLRMFREEIAESHSFIIGCLLYTSSDAVALALRMNAPSFVYEEILETECLKTGESTTDPMGCLLYTSR